jgi:hypothetical protein
VFHRLRHLQGQFARPSEAAVGAGGCGGGVNLRGEKMNNSVHSAVTKLVTFAETDFFVLAE